MHVTRQPLPPLSASERVELRPTFRELLREGGNRLKLWCQRYRTRRQLLALEERILKDIGVTRAAALQEGSKPFWQK